MALLKNIDKDKLSKLSVPDPRKQFNELLKSVSGSSVTRKVNYNIFYQTVGFKGITEGVGCSTIVANTALAIANAGCSVCVVDTSILSSVQDTLLKTPEAVLIENDDKTHLDWFDMPYVKNSVLHISKLNTNISVLSFKGSKLRGVVDMLSTNDSDSLVDLAFAQLRNKFDIILVDICHEPTEVATAALQRVEKVIQVWNDSPHVLACIEPFITNMVTLSCPLDKMRNVVFSRISKDAMGSMDALVKQYRCTKIAETYMSEELYLLNVTGRTLFNAESRDEKVIDFTNAVIDIAAHILNVQSSTSSAVTANDIMDGKVEGTLHKRVKDENEQFAKDHPEVQIDRNPMNNPDYAEQEEEKPAKKGFFKKKDKKAKKQKGAEVVEEVEETEEIEDIEYEEDDTEYEVDNTEYEDDNTEYEEESDEYEEEGTDEEVEEEYEEVEEKPAKKGLLGRRKK